MKSMSLGLNEALRLTMDSIKPLPAEEVALLDSIGRVAATDLHALVDSPSMDSSRKDGYAVQGQDIADASPEKPARLKVVGSMVAGGKENIQVESGTTVRVLTGARIPKGADTVVAEEYVTKADGSVSIESFIDHRLNILSRGGDVALGQAILKAGRKISPVMAGLLAAAGHSNIPVFRNPVVGMVGTGDEIVEPGKPLTEGKLYASNIVTTAGLCRKHRMQTRMSIVKDDPEAILGAFQKMSDETDAMITSGGAWRGDHDYVALVLDKLGWKKVFHRIRIGPGKAVGFGLLNNKPVFILPGGPPSNLMGFLQIALPGLLALGGQADSGLPRIKARLTADINDGKSTWTDFFYGTLEPKDGLPDFHPMIKRSRLNSIAEATAIAAVPEGKGSLQAGEIISVQLMT